MKMMRVTLILAAVFLTALISTSVFADIPPDPGYKRAVSNIVLETDADLADYRFFLVSGNLAREVLLRKGEKTTVSSPGGGARYRNGALYAIPAKSMGSFGDTSDRVKSEELEGAITAGKLAGAIRLFEHQFVKEVPESQAAAVTDSSYRIDRKDGVVTAVSLTPERTEQPKNRGLSNGIVGPYSIGGVATLIAGLFMTLGVAGLGIWMFRSRKKSVYAARANESSSGTR
jgi:hypothetical protein